MTLLSNLSIGARLGLSFSMVIFLMVTMVVFAKFSLSSIGDDLDLLLKDRYVKVKMADEVMDALNQQARSVRNLLLMDDAAVRDVEVQAIESERKRVNGIYDKLGPMLSTERGKALFAQLLDQRSSYSDALTQFLAQVKQGDAAGAKATLYDSLRPKQLAYIKQLDAFTDFQEELMAEAGVKATGTVKSSFVAMVALLVVAVVVAVLAALATTRSIVKPLRGVLDDLKALADGDLTQTTTVTRKDELGDLQRELANTQEALRQVVQQVRNGVESVGTAAAQIAAGNQDLSSRTEEQASSLQETASSMEQLTSTVRQSADNAQQANQLASAASGSASRGGEVVAAVVGTMNEISASSKRIGDIIGVIDGIAFQTNILALNAAVEAARAGEQGRGFAVVASEVRSLAKRSADAAREIKGLIGTSVERVEAGTRQVAVAGETMKEIVDQVRKVTDLIGEIASGSQEQSMGIGQVNQAVVQMDQVTQQNAALVEEAAAAAASMAQQAQRLTEAVSAFRLAKD